jgi:hypothetical protein
MSSQLPVRKYISCTCCCAVLCVEHDMEDDPPVDLTYIAIYERYPDRSFKQRIRLAWQTLKGHPYTDHLVLGKEERVAIIDALSRG